MGFPCTYVTVHFHVHVPAAITFSKEHGLGYKEPFPPKRKGERKLKQDCFDPNKLMVPFDYTDAKQSNLQKPESKGIDAKLFKLTSLLDHINP
jgi:hypothetical protein